MRTMKIFLYLFAAFLLIKTAGSCTKTQAPAPIISADCPDTIKFSTQILPVMTDYCFACHNAGTSPALSDHSTIAANADVILKALKGDGAQLMPDGGPALHDSIIQQFSCWIQQGKKNN